MLLDEIGHGAKCLKILRHQGFRIDLDLRNEKIGFKIREHTLQRVPFLLIVGDREVEEGTVSVRTREGQDLGSMRVGDFAGYLQNEIARRGKLDD